MRAGNLPSGANPPGTDGVLNQSLVGSATNDASASDGTHESGFWTRKRHFKKTVVSPTPCPSFAGIPPPDVCHHETWET